MTKLRRLATLTLAAAAAVACIGVSGESVFAKKSLKVWLPSGGSWGIVAKRYMQSHPNVDVKFINGTMDKFYTMITAGLMPDIWGPWDTPGITADVNRNWALDLTPYIKRDGKAMNIDDFFPGLMRQFRVRAKQYSLPIFNYTDWFFYNTDMWAQSGLKAPTLDASDKSWNWDAMLVAAQKTTQRSASGQLTTSGMQFSRDFWCTPNWVHLWGVKLYSDDAVKSSIPQDIDMNSPQMVNALTKMWDLIYKQKVVRDGFNGGKTGASIEHGWNVINFMNNKKLKWAIAPLPWAVTNSGTMWPDGLRIAKIAKDKELAWDFVKFLCSPESMATLIADPKSDRKGTAAARKSVFSETLGTDVGRATGMKPQDVFRVHEQADLVGVVKESETICLHTDISKQYIEPLLTDLWANKIPPVQAAKSLDDRAKKGMALLFARWMRNVKYTGAQL